MEFTKEYLDKLISDGIEENSQLEYKAAAALRKDNIVEITKDVSSFANAAGGVIIYGIKEHREKDSEHLPEMLDPIDRKAVSKEWLDQICSQIQPKIDGLKIVPVHIGPKQSDYCYVVEVPQGAVAHQARDKRYHRRRNFEITAMDDYEIRDVNNRRKYPVISAQINITLTDSTFTPSAVRIKLSNQSSVMARHYRVVVHLPTSINGTMIQLSKDGLFQMSQEGAYWLYAEGNASVGAPLFPNDERMLVTKIERRSFDGYSSYESLKKIRLILFADEMEKIELSKDLDAALQGWI